MTDRTVKVTLIAQATGYVQGFDQATRKTRELGSEAEKLAQKRQSFEMVGRAFLAVGIAAAIGVGMAVAKFAEFDQAMSQVNAVTQESVANQNLLRDAALEAGGATVFTATEAANAQEELAKAGLSTSYILGGALTGSLNLAAAGQLEVARSAEITGVTLKQFGLDGSQAARVADVLAAGANKAVGGVEELAQGLKFVGPVADSMNVSLEDTVATLTLFADRGILGEQAGTSLRGVLSSLTSPSKAARDELDRLNVTLYDAETKRFLGLENATGELSRALGGVTDAERDMSLGLIFGNQQVTAARVLVGAGAATWREYRAAVDDSGIAARIAAERMDNLSGDVEKLGGAFDTALIKSGSGANDVLRTFVQMATGVIDVIGGLPEPVLSAGLAVGALVAVIGLSGGAALIAVPKYAAFKAALSGLEISGKSAALSIGLVSGALTLAAFVVGTFITQAAEAAGRVNALRDSLHAATGATTDYTEEVLKSQLQQAGVIDIARRLGVEYADLRDAALDLPGAYDKVLKSAEGAARGNALLSGDLDALQYYLGRTQDELGKAAKEQQYFATANKRSQVSLGEVSAGAADTTGNINALVDAMKRYNEQQYRADDATLNFKQTLLDLDSAMGAEGFTGTLDTSTQEGIDNQRMLMDVAGAANAAAAEILALTGDQEAANGVLAEARGKLEAVGAAFGLSGEALQAFIDKYISSPKELTYAAELIGLEGIGQRLGTFFNEWNGRRMTVYVDGSISFGGGNANKAYAYGGYTGPGAKHDVAGIVHADEFVSTKETLAKPSNRAALEYMHAGGDISQWGAVPQQQTWQSAPPMYASAGSDSSRAPQFNVVVQSKGGIDLLQYVDVRIEQKDARDLQDTIGRVYQ